MLIIRQILTPRRSTKRRPNAFARADGGHQKRAHNAARLVEAVADEPGQAGDAGESIEDDDSDDGDEDDRDGDK